MRKQMIDAAFWRDPWVEDRSRDEKLFFMYLLTNPSANIAGVYEIGSRTMQLEADFPKEDLERMFQTFEADGKVYRIKTFIILRNYPKHQNTTSPQVRKGIDRILTALPRDVIEKLLEIEYQYDGLHAIAQAAGILPPDDPTPRRTEAAEDAPDEYEDESIFEDGETDDFKAELSTENDQQVIHIDLSAIHRRAADASKIAHDGMPIPYKTDKNTVSIPYTYGIHTVPIPPPELHYTTRRRGPPLKRGGPASVGEFAPKKIRLVDNSERDAFIENFRRFARAAGANL